MLGCRFRTEGGMHMHYCRACQPAQEREDFTVLAEVNVQNWVFWLVPVASMVHRHRLQAGRVHRCRQASSPQHISKQSINGTSSTGSCMKTRTHSRAICKTGEPALAGQGGAAGGPARGTARGCAAPLRRPRTGPARGRCQLLGRGRRRGRCPIRARAGIWFAIGPAWHLRQLFLNSGVD